MCSARVAEHFRASSGGWIQVDNATSPASFSAGTHLLDTSPTQADRARDGVLATPYVCEALANEAEKIRQFRLGDNRNDVLNASAFGMPALSPMSVLYSDFENSPKGDIKRSLVDMGSLLQI